MKPGQESLHASQVAQEIVKAYHLLCDYHEEVVGTFRAIRQGLVGQDPPLVPLANVTWARDGIYASPYENPRFSGPHNWIPYEIGDFYVDNRFPEPPAQPDKIRLIPGVYFSTSSKEERAKDFPVVTLCILHNITYRAKAPRDLSNLCHEFFKNEFAEEGWEKHQQAWQESLGHTGIVKSTPREKFTLDYWYSWFPLQDLFEGNAARKVNELVVEPLHAKYVQLLQAKA